MRKILISLIALCLMPYAAGAANTDIQVQLLDNEIAKLKLERDSKNVNLNQCKKSVNGFKIAGITTLAATVVLGIVDIHQAHTLNKLDDQLDQVDRDIAAAQKAKDEAALAAAQKAKEDLDVDVNTISGQYDSEEICDSARLALTKTDPATVECRQSDGKWVIGDIVINNVQENKTIISGPDPMPVVGCPKTGAEAIELANVTDDENCDFDETDLTLHCVINNVDTNYKFTCDNDVPKPVEPNTTCKNGQTKSCPVVAGSNAKSATQTCKNGVWGACIITACMDGYTGQSNGLCVKNSGTPTLPVVPVTADIKGVQSSGLFGGPSSFVTTPPTTENRMNALRDAMYTDVSDNPNSHTVTPSAPAPTPAPKPAPTPAPVAKAPVTADDFTKQWTDGLNNLVPYGTHTR